ncbi:glycosyltransferase family 1 protein [Blastococcus sp. Marseille-P5729]|uniref:glycosyltransferase family 4 protein n=1 Tax=Blastococcus sp. Marseille-P5729 TaxID=2086582 RepID=UPI000D0F6934|nr:glycosyltransferase family 1 protein [Blastococcus sp. Marseille-P5729]
MRIALDCTPLLGPRTGVGNYTANVLAQLAAAHPEDQWTATAFTVRGNDLLARVPAGVQTRTRPAPARALRQLWRRTTLPPVELFTGRQDVFHATNFVSPPACRAAQVLTIHDLAYLTHPATVNARSRAYVDLVPLSIRRSRVVCTPSRAVADQVREAYRVPTESVVATPLGVDASWFCVQPDERVRRAHSLPTSYLLAVGTLEPRKNLQRLIDAYAVAGDQPPLVLAGAAGWGTELDTSAVPVGRLIQTGRLPFADLQAVVAGAAGLLMPSLEEGFGLPTIEALACGVPVLASDIAVFREVLDDQATLVDPLEVESIAAGIDQLVREPQGTATSRRERAAGFSWTQCAVRTYAAYQRALEG